MRSVSQVNTVLIDEFDADAKERRRPRSGRPSDVNVGASSVTTPAPAGQAVAPPTRLTLRGVRRAAAHGAMPYLSLFARPRGMWVNACPAAGA